MASKIIKLLAVAALTGATASLHAENTITWETLGNNYSAGNGNSYVQRFVIEADAPFERLAFCQFKRAMRTVNPADTLIEILPGYFAVASERFVQAAPGEPVVVDVLVAGSLRNISFIPDGMHLVAGGKAVSARNVRKPISSWPAQYQYTDAKGMSDGMIYGPEAFAINDSLRPRR